MTIETRGTGGYVQANGIQHHYLEYGQGDRHLVIIPGITSPAITWDFVAVELAKEFHVVTLDVRGRGLSDKPATGFSLPDYAADASGVIKALELDRAIVLGHSMGARIAAALAALYPDVCGPMVIVDPPLTGPGRDPYPTSLESFRAQLDEAYAGATVEDVRAFYPSWPERELQLRVDWLPTCDENAVVETYRYFDSEDFFGYWEKVAPPVLFAYGGESPVISEEGLADVQRANPAARVAAIPGAGHMIPWENFDDFIAEVRGFLADV